MVERRCSFAAIGTRRGCVVAGVVPPVASSSTLAELEGPGGTCIADGLFAISSSLTDATLPNGRRKIGVASVNCSVNTQCDEQFTVMSE